MNSPDVFIIRLFYGMLLGMAIGFEREYNQKRAGLRTQTLVSMGAAAYVYISSLVIGANSGDATRIAGQIASGVGFLGAGVIMRDGLNIRGLNTAATIWCSSSVGCLAGLGLYIEAGFSAFCVICMNYLFKPLANMVSGKDPDFEDTEVKAHLILEVENGRELYIKSLIIQFIVTNGVELIAIKNEKQLHTNIQKIIVELSIESPQKVKATYLKIQNLFTSEIGVRGLEWANLV